MKLPFASLVAAILPSLFLFGQSQAQEAKSSYQITPEPAWVTRIEPSETTSLPATDSSGVLYRLIDWQVQVESENIYKREIKRITSGTGLRNESTIEFSYQPSHQKLALHRLEVRRNGTTLDRLKPEGLRVLQREQDSFRQIYNGEEVVTAILEDVRIGDEIEYSYTVTGFNPIFGNRYVDSQGVQYSVPVADTHLRILWPKNRQELRTKLHGRDEQPTVVDFGEAHEHVWRFKNLEALSSDDQLPDWFNPYPWLQLSEFENWSEVRDWALRLYADPEILSDETIELIERIKKEKSSPEDQVLAALRFVQEEVRYLGMEIGRNSHQPHDPSVVLSRRFGDCKDKTVLLCAILKKLDIEADAALVNTYLADKLEERLPSPLAFNHVIARVRLDGKTYWLDPTARYQRGRLIDVSVDDYARALVANSKEEEIVILPKKERSGPTKTVFEHLILKSYEGPATLNVTTVFEGSQAEAIRYTLANNSVEELQKAYLNFYLKTYSRVSNAQPLGIDDNEEQNRVTLVEKYDLQEPWTTREEKSVRIAVLDAFAITEVALRPRTYERKMPLEVNFPQHVTHLIKVELPESGNFPNENKLIEDEAQRFRYDATLSDKTLTLRFEYQSLKDSVPVEKTGEYLKNLDLIHEICSYAIEFPKTITPGNFWTRVNWPIAFVGILTVAVLCFVGVSVYRQESPPPLVVSEGSAAEPKYEGLRGWLILVGIGLALTPVNVGKVLYESIGAYSPQTWDQLTSSQSEGFHPLWGPLLIGELIGNLTTIAFAILLSALFYNRKVIFPKVYIAFLLFNVLFQAADLVGMHLIPTLAKDIGPQDYRGVTRAVISACIWVAYMLKSRRVKATFVR